MIVAQLVCPIYYVVDNSQYEVEYAYCKYCEPEVPD